VMLLRGRPLARKWKQDLELLACNLHVRRAANA
jgi:hypothetical protein